MKNNRKQNKEELNNLKAICLAKSDELAKKYPDKKFTAWDIISKVLSESSGYDVHFLTLKADLDVIKLIAEGLSVSSIANRLSVPSKYVYDVAKIWGLVIMDSTLDFNPLLVYKEGMTAQELMFYMNDIVPVELDLKTAKDIISNIDKLYDFTKFLEEYYDEEG